MLCAAPLGAHEARAQDREVRFNMPAQPLSEALRAYARVTGEQIIFTEDLVAGRRAPALRGQYASERALGRLLRGAGLVALRTPRGALMILPADDARASSRNSRLRAASRLGGRGDDEIEEVVVTGRRIEDMAQAYARAVALAPTSAGQYARWNFQLCPSVAGLAETDAQVLIDHIARRGHEVGVDVEPTGCVPNLVIIFAPDSDRLAQHIVASRSDVLGFYGEDDVVNAGRAELDEFANTPRAVRWWHVSRTMSADGQGLDASVAGMNRSSRTGGGMLNPDGSPGAISGVDGVPAVRSQGTRMRRTTRQDLSFALVVVDMRRTSGAAPQALADYLAMAALVQLNPDADMSGFPSILNLFADSPEGESAPTAMTDWDLAYLQALYGMTRAAVNARQQRGEIARRMADRVASE
jgi:hypothetical protein